MPRLSIAANVGAGAPDSRMTMKRPRVGYNPASGPGPASPASGGWPRLGVTSASSGSTTPEVRTLLFLTLGEIAGVVALRRLFRRYHGG